MLDIPHSIYKIPKSEKARFIDDHILKICSHLETK